MSLSSIQTSPENTEIIKPANNSVLQPLVTRTGGKRRELPKIIPRIPTGIKNYYEPFVGGGAVFTAVGSQENAIGAESFHINDKSKELMDLYRILVSKERQRFFTLMEEIRTIWEMLGEIQKTNQSFFIDLCTDFLHNTITEEILTIKIHNFVQENSQELLRGLSAFFNYEVENFINEVKKGLGSEILQMKKRKEKAEKNKNQSILSEKDVSKSIQKGLKGALYYHFRLLYNQHKKYGVDATSFTAIFVLIRTLSYGGMFRSNSKGEFNTPYAGMSYNSKNFEKIIQRLSHPELYELLKKTTICDNDYGVFLGKKQPTENDFVFGDPPYDTRFQDYGPKSPFGIDKQERFSRYLTERCRAQWMVVIQKTDLILGLYEKPGVNIDEYEVQYRGNVNNQSIGDKVRHLLITNY